MEFHSDLNSLQSSELDELEFIQMSTTEYDNQRGGYVDEDNDQYEEDFKAIFEKAKEYGRHLENPDRNRFEEDNFMMGGNDDDFDTRKEMLLKQIGSRMIGGKKGGTPALLRLLDVSAIIQQSGPYKDISLMGVAKLIWDEAVNQLGGDQSDVQKIIKISSELAKKPQVYVEKYKKMSDIGTIVMNSGVYKGIKKMDAGRLVWEAATKIAKQGASLDDIEKIAIDLASKNPKSYVDLYKKMKAEKAKNVVKPSRMHGNKFVDSYY